MATRCKWNKDKGWIHLSSGLPYYLTGKYLFFCDDPERLVHIAEQEMLDHAMPLATIPLEPRGKSYVLCLFDVDEARKAEIAERFADDYDDGEVVYRGWKPSKGMSWRGRTITDEQYVGVVGVARVVRPELDHSTIAIPSTKVRDSVAVESAKRLAEKARCSEEREGKALTALPPNQAPVRVGRIDPHFLGGFEAVREREWGDMRSVWSSHGAAQVIEDLNGILMGNPHNYETYPESEIYEGDIPY
jgi:hypothetical protein